MRIFTIQFYAECFHVLKKNSFTMERVINASVCMVIQRC